MGTIGSAGSVAPRTGPKKERLSFPRKDRLKGREEIQAVFKNRKLVSCTGAKLFVMKSGLPHSRIAFTFTRKFGTAVERNRSRRLSREAYRQLRPFIVPGWDMVLLIYPDGPEGKAERKARRKTAGLRTAQLRELLEKARILDMNKTGEAVPGNGN